MTLVYSTLYSTYRLDIKFYKTRLILFNLICFERVDTYLGLRLGICGTGWGWLRISWLQTDPTADLETKQDRLKVMMPTPDGSTREVIKEVQWLDHHLHLLTTQHKTQLSTGLHAKALET